jgi:hypothetical protein
MAVDIPEMVAKFMASHDDTDVVRKMRCLESSHGEVLCAAKNDGFVDIICRRFLEISCGKGSYDKSA